MAGLFSTPHHPSTAQAAGEAEAALFRLRTLLAHVVTAGRHAGHRSGARPSSGMALACLDELQQLLQYLQVGRGLGLEGKGAALSLHSCLAAGSLLVDGQPVPLCCAIAFSLYLPTSQHAPSARFSLAPSCRRRGACRRARWLWTPCSPRTAMPSPERCSSATWCRAAPAPLPWWPQGAGAEVYLGAMGLGRQQRGMCDAGRVGGTPFVALVVPCCSTRNPGLHFLRLNAPPPLPPFRRYDTLLKQTWVRQSALSGTVAPMPPLHAVGEWMAAQQLQTRLQAAAGEVGGHWSWRLP